MKLRLKTVFLLALHVVSALTLAGGVLSARSAFSAEEGPPPSTGRPALVPDAPHWASRASSVVWLRHTTKWQELKSAAAARGLAPPALEAHTATGVVFGQTVFNKDASALPQNETSVAMDPKNANRVVGGYNDYRGLLPPPALPNFTGWSISTDGGVTVAKDGQLRSVTILGVSVPSQGDPVVAVDTNGNFFMGSLQFDADFMSPSGITVFRSPAAGGSTGVFGSSCTGGTNVDCWPTVNVVAAETCTSSGGHFYDKDYIAVDRSTSAASGSVYVIWTLFGCADSSSAIQIAKCTNNLASCTAPVTLDSTTGTGAALDFVQLSHLTVGPTGKVYVTWVAHSGNSPDVETDSIRLRVITPTASASSIGTLGPLRTVQTETSPIPWDTAPYPARFRTATYPKVGVQGSRAVIVWDRRVGDLLLDAFYMGSSILGKTTDNDGASFSAVQTVSSGAGFRYQPTICVASSNGPVVVGYASHQNDAPWFHRQDWYVATSFTGAAPFTPLRVTPVSNDTEQDPVLSDTFIGDYPEVACQGKVGYLHYTANYAAKSGSSSGFSGVIRQQDTFLGKFSLP